MAAVCCSISLLMLSLRSFINKLNLIQFVFTEAKNQDKYHHNQEEIIIVYNLTKFDLCIIYGLWGTKLNATAKRKLLKDRQTEGQTDRRFLLVYRPDFICNSVKHERTDSFLLLLRYPMLSCCSLSAWCQLLTFYIFDFPESTFKTDFDKMWQQQDFNVSIATTARILKKKNQKKHVCNIFKIFNIFPTIAERILTQLDKKQISNVLYKVCVFVWFVICR